MIAIEFGAVNERGQRQKRPTTSDIKPPAIEHCAWPSASLVQQSLVPSSRNWRALWPPRRRRIGHEVWVLKSLFPQNLLRNNHSEAIALSALEEPIRAELFSIERLEQHAESLAAAQRVTTTPRRAVRCCRACWTTGGSCSQSYRAIAKAIREERAITPAAEWLVDNFHIVEEQLREIRDDLPPGYYRELPKLAEGPLDGLSARLRLGLGVRRAYRQPVRPGDASPLRARLPARAAADDRRAVGGRHHLAGRARRESPPPGGAHRAGDGRRARRPTRWPTACWVSAAVQRSLRRRSCGDSRAARWRRPSRYSSSSGCAIRIRRSRRRCAGSTNGWRRRARRPTRSSGSSTSGRRAMNVTVRNVITSMRLISAFDWAEFFESVSLVDAVLWADTGFAAMDFATRDRYRHAIEELSRGSEHSELEVARRAVFKRKLRAAKRQKPVTPLGTGARIPATTSSRTGASPSSRNSAFVCRSRLASCAPMCTQRDVSVPWNHRESSAGLILALFLFNSRRGGSRSRGLRPPRASRARPGFGSGDRVSQSRRHRAARAAGAAQAGAP